MSKRETTASEAPSLMPPPRSGTATLARRKYSWHGEHRPNRPVVTLSICTKSAAVR